MRQDATRDDGNPFDREPGTSRRSVLAGVATAAALALPLAATGAASAEEDHAAHTGGAKHQALIDAAIACVGRGEVCGAHCVDLIAKGHAALKDCLRSVAGMLPVCTALARLAALDAPRLTEFAKVCRNVCDDCEQECKKHQDEHAVCKACAEACAACSKECKKLLDA